MTIVVGLCDLTTGVHFRPLGKLSFQKEARKRRSDMESTYLSSLIEKIYCVADFVFKQLLPKVSK
ncbi:hypothetical protein T4B_13754 [Trichinella pseudospiralis]|uniref:Uncharacterized protein n=1 Tax=Trichinella pseudospiralis TaxID=6337 RepID=A0A0V1IK09_TRIPS|nr:hypothetical protein T4B_13754 [Trichinella pseudospiralis]KRZ29171.1 hypothetical protein T4C_11240 [Trichinella pseudospiralis]